MQKPLERDKQFTMVDDFIKIFKGDPIKKKTTRP